MNSTLGSVLPLAMFLKIGRIAQGYVEVDVDVLNIMFSSYYKEMFTMRNHILFFLHLCSHCSGILHFACYVLIYYVSFVVSSFRARLFGSHDRRSLIVGQTRRHFVAVCGSQASGEFVRRRENGETCFVNSGCFCRCLLLSPGPPPSAAEEGR